MPTKKKYLLGKLIPFVFIWASIFWLNAPSNFRISELNLSDAVIIFLWIFFAIYLFPYKIAKTSDIFIVIYVPLAFIGNSFVWIYTEAIDRTDVLVLLFLNAVPLVLVKFFARPSKKIRLDIPLPTGIPVALLPFFLICLLSISLTISFYINGDVGSFDFLSHYDRRLLMMERVAFSDSKLLAYFLNMTNVGLLTTMAFVGGYSRKTSSLLFYSFFVVFFAVVQFWLFGTKSTLFYGVFMLWLGKFYGENKFEKLPIYFLWLFAIISLLAVFDQIFNEVSYINAVIIDRIFILPAKIQNYYIHEIVYNQPGSFFSGLDVGTHRSVDFLIGQNYYQNQNAEVNTSAFINAIAVGGLHRYILCILCVYAFFLITNALDKKIPPQGTMAVASIYAICLLGQSFSVALFSSGVLLSLLLIILFRKQIK